MRIYVTGTVCVERGEAAVHGQPLGSQAGIVLTMLALEAGRTVRHEELAENLWPEQLPASWRTNLRSIVSRTRSALRPLGERVAEAIGGHDRGYRLRLSDADWVDFAEAIRSVHVAEAALTAGRPHDAACAAWLTEVIARRGFLDQVDGVWIDAQRSRLRTVRIRALDALTASLSALGDHDEAIRHAEIALSIDPYRERSHQALIAAHSRADDRSSAVRALRRCEALLEELGVQPTRATRDAVHATNTRHGASES
jgi:DNA-binding SARP family transcriptional activator